MLWEAWMNKDHCFTAWLVSNTRNRKTKLSSKRRKCHAGWHNLIRPSAKTTNTASLRSISFALGKNLWKKRAQACQLPTFARVFPAAGCEQRCSKFFLFLQEHSESNTSSFAPGRGSQPRTLGSQFRPDPSSRSWIVAGRPTGHRAFGCRTRAFPPCNERLQNFE